ncbi:hypothetical protein EC957_009770 [Mortierella hygrophila]|uniref:EF-hand domain-containing protein n=1 Tax=Mortierella hygrophila TaxID=979708 RepID=A0A9P6FBN0_9FUNG|nr:hypothetical protein EC957_009770 [Mortierella hygrophila]
MSTTAVAEPDPGPTHVEATKDRSSIKLMDLPMTKKNKDKSKDTTPLSDTNSSSSEHTKHQQHPSSSSSSSSISSTKTKKRSATAANIEHDSDPSFLPADNNEDEDNATSTTATTKQQADSTDKDSQDNVHTSSESVEEEEDQSSTRDRVGNPPHYETREERQIRIRKQFNQLDEERSGFVDANSLVTFFADVTPDRNVQQRYADELLQLCHAKALHRNRTNSNGHSGTHRNRNQDNTHNDDGLSDQRSFHGASSEHGYDQNGDGDDSDRTSGSDRTPHNGRLRYDDFQVFVEEKEERLWNLFREIDHNNDNELQADEIQASLTKAGIDLSDADLEQFIKAMDKDGDGVIDYEEWRDFLVLLPREPTLKEIFHYVQEVVAQVGVDGDVVMPPSENDYVARYLLAGAIAGAVSRTVTAPLDRLKVYLITNSMPALTGQVAQAGLKHIPKLSTPSAVAPVKQRLLWNAIVELYQQGGVKTFFRGNGLNIIKIAPESAIKFYTYETSKSFIVHHMPSMTIQHYHPPSPNTTHSSPVHVPEIATSGRFLAGGIAGLVSQFSIYPLETIKTRIMSSTVKAKAQKGATSQPSLPSPPSTASPSSSSSSLASTGPGATAAKQTTCIRSVAREMWQQAGLRGFYRGLGPSLVGIFPYAAIDLSVFETLKFGYMRWKAGLQEGDDGSEEKALDRPSVFVLLACGTISGSVGATSVYPLSLVRTRLQAQGTPQHPQTYTSTLDVFRKTYERDGIRGFYKGMVPTLTKVVPAVSISYVVYEYSKRELGL